MPKDETDVNSILCDPKTLLGRGELEEVVIQTLSEAGQMPERSIGLLVRSKLKKLSPDEAKALCLSIAEHGDPAMIGKLVKLLIARRIQDN